MKRRDRRHLRWANELTDIGGELLEADHYQSAVAAWRLADVLARGLTMQEVLRNIYRQTYTDMRSALFAQTKEYQWIEAVW